jgi:hypothetical protein
MNGKDESLTFWEHPRPYEAVWDLCSRISKRTQREHADAQYHAALYDGEEIVSLTQRSGAQGEFTPQTLTTNIVKRHVDTYVAHRSKSRSLPMAITKGATYAQLRRAEALNRLFEGLLHQVRFYEARDTRIRDSAVWGSGINLNFRDGHKLFHERTFRWEWRVDPGEAERGNPRTIHLTRRIDRGVAKKRWPGHDRVIDESAEGFDDEPTRLSTFDTSDRVMVVSSWHLPSREGADDGAYTVCVSKGSLEVSEYKRPTFPVSKRDFSPALAGWFGTGMVEMLAGIQYEANAVGLKLQERHCMTGSYVLIDDNSGTEIDLIDNGTLTEVRYRGSPPQFVQPPAAHPDLLNFYQQLRGPMPAEETRISEMSTRGETPAGLRSGRAQRVHRDIESSGFAPDDRRDETDVVDTAWQLFDLAEECHEEGKEEGKPYTVTLKTKKHGRTFLEDVEYSKLRADRESFVLETFPVNYLSSMPQDRVEQVADMVDRGLI